MVPDNPKCQLFPICGICKALYMGAKYSYKRCEYFPVQYTVSTSEYIYLEKSYQKNPQGGCLTFQIVIDGFISATRD